MARPQRVVAAELLHDADTAIHKLLVTESPVAY
jgi:hypothetical protein